MPDSIKITLSNKNYKAVTKNGLSLSIILDFEEKQPRFFDTPPALAKPLYSQEFKGSVEQGGPCNVESITAIFHTSGTHTECIGHISRDRISLADLIENNLITSTLVTISPETIGEDSYHVPTGKKELFITLKMLKKTLTKMNKDFVQGLIIRTKPNDESKISRDYDKHPFPYFTSEAMTFIRDLGVHHLLVDIPSVDRADDGGQLGNHRILWEVNFGETIIDPNSCSRRTITEMIFAPNSIPDGSYILNLQLPAFASDASPSRPIIYPIEEIDEN